MTFLVISRAETLHTLRYKPGKHFWNLVGGYFLLISGPFLRKKIGKKFGNSPLQRYEPGHTWHLFFDRKILKIFDQRIMIF